MRERKAPTKNQLAQKVQGQTEALDKRVENIEMTSRISQMLIQQMGNSMSQLAADVRELANRQRDIQYRLLAIQDLSSGVDVEAVNKLAEDKQVKDFSEASAKENEDLGYTPSEEVDEDSVVVFTTKTEVEGKDILRSKLILSEIALPDFKDALLKKKAGDSFDADIQGTTHAVTVLEVFHRPPQEVEVDGQDQA